jgi:hypothetical protein
LSAQTTDDYTRTEILQLLNKHQVENPNSKGLDRAIIQAVTKLTDAQLELNMLFMEEKGLVTLKRNSGSKWVFAEIMPEGVKVAMGINSQNSTPELSEEGGVGVMGDVFKQARYRIRETRLSSGDMAKIEKLYKELEAELKRGKKTDLGKIQKIIKKLNENPYGVTPEISKLVLETVKAALNLP